MPATSATGKAICRPAHARRSGFTLIELLVVLAIIVLMTALLPLALNRMLPARRAATAADRLVTDIRLLQGESLRTGAPGRLTLLPTGYRLALTGEGGAREVALPETTTVSFRGRGEDRAISELLVWPDGTASPGQFNIEDSGRRVTVETRMLTGRVQRLHRAVSP